MTPTEKTLIHKVAMNSLMIVVNVGRLIKGGDTTDKKYEKDIDRRLEIILDNLEDWVR